MFSRIAQSSLFVLVLALPILALAQTASEQSGKTSIIIERQLVRFTTQAEAVEWHLVVTNQQAEVIFDSGFVYGNALEWPLLNQQGQAIESGLYTYTLTTKAVTAASPRTQRGHLIVDRASNLDRVWATSSQEISLGTSGETLKLTIIGSSEASLGGVELPVSVPRREEGGARSQMPADAPGRPAEQQLEDGSRAAPTGPKATLATAGRLSKFADAAGNLTDSGVLETAAGGGLVQTFGNTAATSGAFNHVVEIVAASGKTPLTLIGGAGAMEFWRDSTPTSAIAFGVAKPALPAVATNDMIFSTYASGSGWFERMRLTNSGNLGIGTNNPASARLQVYSTTVDRHLYLSDAAPSLALGNDPARSSAAMNSIFALSTSDFHYGVPAGGLMIANYGDARGNIYINSNYSGGGVGRDVILQPSFGNVGIGTGDTSPQAKLDVRGNIKLGSNGQYFATSGEENLRIVRGVVDGFSGSGCNNNGNAPCPILAGSGFQAQWIDNGDYLITLNTPFNGTPAVVVTPDQYISQRSATTYEVGTGSFKIHIEDDANRIFAFIAIGPR